MMRNKAHTVDEELTNRVRKALAHLPDVEEKKMFGFIVFMVNGRMCLGVRGDEMMCRISPELIATAVERKGCNQLIMKGRESRRMIMVDQSGMKTKKDFDYWIGLALDYNRNARAGNGALKPRRKQKRQTRKT